MKLKGLLTVCIAVTCLSLFGCVSTTYQKSNTSGNNLDNIPGYKIITNKDEDNSILLQYAKLVRVLSVKELELDPHGFDNKEVFIQASITHNPPLKELPQLPDFILSRPLLRPDGIFVLEHGQANDFSNHPHFLEHRSYGSVNFSLFKSVANQQD